jgi:hexosaminidase
MLDAGRYFYSVGFIKKYIDYLAFHKMNTFHWHLTEDHGWRIEIKKYPRLTQIGAWRAGTQFDRYFNQVDPSPHWGYYTQEQIRDIVAYAQRNYVTVVPEIEMPGHSLAALVAYPELSCSGGPFKMPVQWAIQKDIYCAGNEKTYEFLKDVLTEVAALFPGNTIHIGGDEAPKDHWKACPKCQARIKTLGLKDEHELQSYFIKRIENFLLTKNKRIIGWDEILEGGLAPNAAVMSWRGIKGGVAAAKQQHEVIMTPAEYAYLDYYQGDSYLEPAAIGGLLTLEKVYGYEPVPAELSPAEAAYIKGVQGNVWSEYIHSPGKVEYMAFPRAAALAEVAWTQPGLKNWDDFKRRMEQQYLRYDDLAIHYARTAYNPRAVVQPDSVAGTARLTFKTDSYRPEVHYTLDGAEPTARSPKFSAPLTVKMPLTVKAATFKNGKIISQVSVRSIALPAK